MSENNKFPEPYSAETTNEEISFELLFKEYYSRLVYFSYHIVGDKANAEDIVQEAFVKFWNQKEDVASHKTVIKNYLYSTVKNASLNVVRHDKVVEKHHSKLSTSDIDDSTIDNLIIHSEVLAEIHRALSSLPESCQKISRMGYLEGMKNHEIATTLGVSVNTVKTQKQRALQLLRLRLNPGIISILIALSY